jgi:hypothetical protein
MRPLPLENNNKMVQESRYILDVSRAHSGDLGNLHCIKHRPPFVAKDEEETGTEGEVMEWGWVRVGGMLRLPPYPKLSWISGGSRYEVAASWVQF